MPALVTPAAPRKAADARGSDGAQSSDPPPQDSRALYEDAVRPLVGPLVGVARRILRSDDLARDAVQEALLVLWREGPLPPNPRAWLIRAVTLRSLHMARSQSRRRRHEDRACLGRPETTDRDDPTLRLEAEEFREALHEALEEMTNDQRDIIVLRLIEDLDYATIAERLRLPRGTVRSRLNRSRKALRDALARRLAVDSEGPPPVPDEDPGSQNPPRNHP